MPLPQEVRQTYNAIVNNGSITYAIGLTDTPASGAPGAFKKMLANATPTTPWWLTAFVVGNLSGAGATAFNFGVNRAEDGSGTNIFTTRILLEAALATIAQRVSLAYPARTANLVGAGAQQLTASGKTLDVTIEYAQVIGS